MINEFPKTFVLSKMIIYGTCEECGGYLINTTDELSAKLGCIDIRCSKCGKPSMEVEDMICQIKK